MPVFFITLGVWYLVSESSLGNWSSNRCFPVIENGSSATTFGLRVPESNCTIDEASYQRSIQKWVSEHEIDAAPIEGFYLGRVIRYPWISQYLARAAIKSKDWDLARGTSHNDHPYRLIESFLIDEEFRRRLDAPFAGTPYTVNRVSVEKVLIEDASTVLEQYDKGFGKVPYDALLWVDLVERQKD